MELKWREKSHKCWVYFCSRHQNYVGESSSAFHRPWNSELGARNGSTFPVTGLKAKMVASIVLVVVVKELHSLAVLTTNYVTVKKKQKYVANERCLVQLVLVVEV